MAAHIHLTVEHLSYTHSKDRTRVLADLWDNLSIPSTAPSAKKKKHTPEEEEEPAPRWPYLAGCQHMFEKSPKIGVMCGAKKKPGSIYCSRHVVTTKEGELDNRPPASHHIAFMNKAIGRAVHAITGFVLDNVDKKLVIGRYFRDATRAEPERKKLEEEGYHALLPSDTEEILWWKLKAPPTPTPPATPPPRSPETPQRSPKTKRTEVVLDDPEDVELTLMLASKKAKVKAKDPEPVVIFTDGACPSNGQGATVAGAGVWFGDDDPRNLSERVPGMATNNRAEMWAAIRALEAVSSEPWVRIVTDSQLLVNSMTVWLPKWQSKNFKGVSNVDLIQRLLELSSNRRIEWQYTPGHVGVLGNERADELARRACDVPRASSAPPTKATSIAASSSSAAALKERLKVLNPKAGSTKAKTKVAAEKAQQQTEETSKTRITFTDVDSDTEM